MAKIALVALLLIIAASSASAFLHDRQVGEKCNDGAQCESPEHCCNDSKEGSYCCDTDESCCYTLCCNATTESCCPDPVHGSVCCLAETTYCCPPIGQYPSRCCPRWNICCNGGRYGCCDAVTGEPIDELPDVHAPPKTPNSPKAPTTAYGLYEDFDQNFAGMSIDMSSGSHTYKAVSGFNDWGEIARVFTYDPTHNLFYLFQADFLGPDQKEHNITLYAVDPVAGTAAVKTVQGAVVTGQHDVTGFWYNPSTGVLLLSVEIMDNSHSQLLPSYICTDALTANVVGYNFYHVNPSTAVAQLVSTYKNQGADEYVGWFTDVATNGTTLFRLGYRDVANQADPGVGITDISTSVAKTRWVSSSTLKILPGLNWYISLNVHGDSFISLAPDQTDGDLSIVKWDVHGNANLISTLSDGYNTPHFGPLAEYINTKQTTYAALVVYNSWDSDFDRWELVQVDLASGQTSAVELYPYISGQASSVAGLGFP